MAQKGFVIDSTQLENLSAELGTFPREIRSAMRSSLTMGIRNSLMKIAPQYYAIDTSTLAKTFRVTDRATSKGEEAVQYEVSGRRLSLSHFRFSPFQQAYPQPLVEIIKGHVMQASKRVGQDGKMKTPFVMHTGAKDAAKVQMNVFIRSGKKKASGKETVQGYRTVSVPQMLGHESLADAVQANLLECFEKSLLKRIEQRTGIMQQNIVKG